MVTSYDLNESQKEFVREALALFQEQGLAATMIHINRQRLTVYGHCTEQAINLISEAIIARFDFHLEEEEGTSTNWGMDNLRNYGKAW